MGNYQRHVSLRFKDSFSDGVPALLENQPHHSMKQTSFMNHLFRTIFAAGLMALLLNGCAVKQPVPQPRYPQQPARPRAVAPPPPPTSPQPTISRPAVPPPTAATVPTTVSPPRLGAGASLYASAKDAMAQGNHEQAEMMLERALKIEPRNAHYWYAMAEVKYNQGLYSEAVHLSSKSKSLAGKDSQLLRQNDMLRDKARKHY